MAIPFLLTLTKTARFAYPLIQKGVRAGLASRSIAGTLSKAGLGIRRSTLLSIMRKERSLVQHGLNMRFLPLKRFPNPLKLPTALTKLRRAYSYTIELRGRLIDTQELITRQVTVASSKLLTRQQAEKIAGSYLMDTPEAYGMELDKAQLINVVKAGEQGTLL